MKKSVGDALVERLAAWGVRRVYGYPGDGINGVVGAIARAENAVTFIEPQRCQDGARDDPRVLRA